MNMFGKRGQGAFEYILLIGGVLVIVVLVVLVLRGVGSSGGAAVSGELDKILCGGMTPVALSNSGTIAATAVKRAAVVIDGQYSSTTAGTATFTIDSTSFPVNLGCTDQGVCQAYVDRVGSLSGVSFMLTPQPVHIRLLACA